MSGRVMILFARGVPCVAESGLTRSAGEAGGIPHVPSDTGDKRWFACPTAAAIARSLRAESCGGA
jgi:hypothetical protein